ncbi:MAG: transcription termination factor Rho [Atopobiaceae bacterium]
MSDDINEPQQAPLFEQPAADAVQARHADAQPQDQPAAQAPQQAQPQEPAQAQQQDASTSSPEATPRRRTTRRRKPATDAQQEQSEGTQEQGAQADAPKPHRRRRAGKKALEAAEAAQQAAQAQQDADGQADQADQQPKPARRRARKADPEQVMPVGLGPQAAQEHDSQESQDQQDQDEGQRKPARRTRTRRARRSEAQAEEQAQDAQQPQDQPQADSGDEAEGSQGESEQGQQHAQRRGRQRHPGDLGSTQPEDDQASGEGNNRRRRHNRERVRNSDQHNDQRGSYNDRNERGRNSRYDRNDRYQDNRNNRRNNNRRNNRSEQQTEPSLTIEDLQVMKVAELRSKAAELDVEHVGLRKAELVQAIYKASALAEGFRPVDGILDIQSEGYGFLRTGNYMQGDNDAFVHQQLIRQYGLRPGDRIQGSVTPGRSNNKFPPLGKIDAINGMPPEMAKKRPRFRDLTPIYPNERLIMEHGKDSITGRAIDLVAPIGKGQRGLIVSPPKAGKTTVLKNICQSITANNPEVHLFCLLVDERPEEVTDMERSIQGTVVASTFDMPASNHTAVSELVIEHAKRLVEMGQDVVVVLDSITRLARAYNLAAPASGRILSGGVDSAALYPPKKFLGAARNIENGGSLTILASALVDTGSKMDEVIFEEFKGTGNMELKLDRELADKRIFPAIDPVASGTRNEELLLDPELTPFIWGIRRVLANMNNTERAATALVKGLRATASNEEFLIRSAKKAQQTEYML